MADLSFLGNEVSTGNSAAGNAAEKVELRYDPNKAHLEQEFKIPLTEKYMQRALKLMQELKFEVCGNLKTVLERRARTEKVVTYREADIMLRKGIDSSTHLMLLQCLFKFDSYITEEDKRFSLGIFALRARYNKGIQWKNNPSLTATRTPEMFQKGEQKLVEIKMELQDKGFPIHWEEVDVGFHQEFLKPEHLTWNQFQIQFQEAASTRTIAEKESTF